LKKSQNKKIKMPMVLRRIEHNR